jgi:SUMO ligase MMS21 Smc5/6 complex component
MLEEKDLKLIKQMVQEVIEEEVLPQFVDVYDRFENIDRRFDNVDQRLSRIETTMVTKDHLEDRLSDFKTTLKQSGGRALRQIKIMASDLHKNGTLTAKQVVQITTA